MAKKVCPFCNKEVPAFWKAKTRERDPCCKNCLPEYNEKYEVRKEFKKPANPFEGVGTFKQNKIKQISSKQAEKFKEYRPLRDKYLLEHPVCEINSPVCVGTPVELHHKKPRRYHLCDVSIFCAACRPCNDYVESHHQWARERGFKIDHL